MESVGYKLTKETADFVIGIKMPEVASSAFMTNLEFVDIEDLPNKGEIILYRIQRYRVIKVKGDDGSVRFYSKYIDRIPNMGSETGWVELERHLFVARTKELPVIRIVSDALPKDVVFIDEGAASHFIMHNDEFSEIHKERIDRLWQNVIENPSIKRIVYSKTSGLYHGLQAGVEKWLQHYVYLTDKTIEESLMSISEENIQNNNSTESDLSTTGPADGGLGNAVLATLETIKRTWIPRINQLVMVEGRKDIYVIDDIDVYDGAFILTVADSARASRIRSNSNTSRISVEFGKVRPWELEIQF